MRRWSVQSKDRMFVKGYRFLSFTKKMGRNIGNLSRNLSSKHSQELLDHAKHSATALKRAIWKTAEATGFFIGNTITDEIARVTKTSPKHN